MSKFVEVNEKIAEKVVGGYKKIEEGTVGGFNKVADKFVESFLAKEGETVEEAKERLSANIKTKEESEEKGENPDSCLLFLVKDQAG